jgi:hypothetical protein
MTYITTPYGERLVSKRRIKRHKKEVNSTFTIMARNDCAVAKINEKIEASDGTTQLFRNAQKKFLEFSKKSAAKQNTILLYRFERAMAEANELEDHNVEITKSRNTPKGA